jgi:hypothetical protein
MLFFQQSSVVDKGMLEKDIPWGRFDTLLGSILRQRLAGGGKPDEDQPLGRHVHGDRPV